MMNNMFFKFFSQNTGHSENPYIFRKFSQLFFWLALSLVWLPSNGFAQTECPSVNVKIQNISNNTGVIACAIFESGEGFPNKFLKFAPKIMITQISGTDASFEFSDILPGKYAIAVIHDENRNGELDTNMFGFPKEGYGFSSGAEVTLSAPSFSDAEFLYDGGVLEMSINLNY
ncbi:Uncharacterized conserved protein, DUF2141 family [Salegentibacter salegens]|uniref:Uncharacterized conserved protein, DUF2141 family n=2 Tax=Salegentibacter salegens TaxID=143223 RepID=A0A1M7IBF1_9FLAO|nr:uncharacterized protein (DUF2141 family) [Salegentibacter salegens]SHM37923.1 Uncharacterized conserved protein, DUF2141 family [Salegentibacter salegens]